MKANALVAGSVAFLSLVGSPSAQEPTPVVVGYPPTVDYLPAYVSAENGCFAAKGLAVTMTLIPIATNIPPALLSNSLQIGVVTPTTLLQTIEGGLNLKAVAGAARVIKGKEGISVVTSSDFSANGAQDFIGKKVGVPGIMSIADLMFRKWLKDNGVADNQLTFVEVPFARMAEMMNSGNVDAVVATEPARSMLVASGVGQRAPFEYHTEVVEDSLLTMFAAEAGWAESHPEAVAGFKQCLRDGIEWIGANHEEADATELKYTNFQTGLREHTWTADVTAEDFEVYPAAAVEFGLISEGLDLNEVVFP